MIWGIPYLSMSLWPLSSVSYTHLDVYKRQVLRNDGTVIPGLYGVGDATSAMHRREKLAVISELTWAVASAYRSAVHAVNEMEVRT